MMKEMKKVDSVAVGSSSTNWGGNSTGGKAKTNNRYKAWDVDRNKNPGNQGFGGK